METILAHVLKTERELKDLRAFVRKLMSTMGRMKQRNGKGILGR